MTFVKWRDMSMHTHLQANTCRGTYICADAHTLADKHVEAERDIRTHATHTLVHKLIHAVMPEWDLGHMSHPA